jgi:hypothetical protein
MRKVFLFWIVVLLLLLAGAAAIIYGKTALKTEREKEAKIMEELNYEEESELEVMPLLPSGDEIKDLPAFESAEPAPEIIPEEESY